MDSIEKHRKRIETVYENRNPKNFLGFESMAHVFRKHERFTETIRLFHQYGYDHLDHVVILDTGCGDGNSLRQYMVWGALCGNLHGIDIRREPLIQGKHILPDMNLIHGSVTALPWPDQTFDIVSAHTVFSSILEKEINLQAAREIWRVLKTNGILLWYDMRYNNPFNKNVKGISYRELKNIFPDSEIDVRSITVLPGIARRIPYSFQNIALSILSFFPFLNTHYFGVIRKRS